ncbi:MAG: hypothetical protein IPG53_19945 [Ignavibacteriales bacterium]|nr:hypothetical protein [Ignavibacteriales bacterium]
MREYSEVDMYICLHWWCGFCLSQIKKLCKSQEGGDAVSEIFGDDFILKSRTIKWQTTGLFLKECQNCQKNLGSLSCDTNECHYIKQEDAVPTNVLLKLSEKGDGDYRNLRYGTDQIYFKSQEEMLDLFKEHPDSITNTLEILTNVMSP